MNTITAIRATVIQFTLALVAWPAGHSWAQAVSEPQSSSPAPGGVTSSSGMATAAVVVLVVATLVLLIAVTRMLDLKRKRENEAMVLQAQISDAVLRDPRLFSLAITPTAHVPFRKGSPAIVEVAGQVPSEDLRQAALGLITREASRIRQDVRVESRMGVVPTMARRSA